MSKGTLIASVRLKAETKDELAHFLKKMAGRGLTADGAVRILLDLYKREEMKKTACLSCGKIERTVAHSLSPQALEAIYLCDECHSFLHDAGAVKPLDWSFDKKKQIVRTYFELSSLYDRVELAEKLAKMFSADVREMKWFLEEEIYAYDRESGNWVLKKEFRFW